MTCLGEAEVNASKIDKRPYTDYYDGVTRDLVADIFREDCERFGYRF